jgi:1-acyl-sn-glycerol-3-phosphate acyltransferase
MLSSTKAPRRSRTASGSPPHPALLPLRLLYACYAGGVFLLLGAAALPLLLLLPGLRRRRTLIRGVARAALACIGMRLSARGLAHLPQPCVVVANHESYLDGVVLCALLPASFGFVIKREMHAVPGAGWLLTRIGAQFVARNNAHGSRRDALRVLRSAAGGQSLAFFPEGTFKPVPGLLPFQNGAFTAASRAGMPVVPLVIRGTRRCLAPGTPLPWPGRIRVQALPPIHPAVHADKATLREAARSAILVHTGLPDHAAAHARAHRG